MPNVSDYLQRPSGGNVTVLVGTWVQLVNNVTTTAYVSTAVTDANGKFTVNNVPAGTYTVNTGPTSGGPFTSTGDTNYTVATGSVQLDIRDFGGVGDGSTDNSTAFSNAVAALPSTGGTITLPAGTQAVYVFASGINLNSKSFVRVIGSGPVIGGGSGSASQIKFTTTSGPLLSATTSVGIEFEDLMILWPNAFTGVVLALDGTAGTPTSLARVSRCIFEATGGGSNAGLCLSLDDVIDTKVDRCAFHNANAGVQGLGTAGHFSNAVQIRDCIFSSSTGDISSAHIRNPGQGWLIEGC